MAVNSNDFVIENGVLLKYNGSDAVVTIPEGITEIGERVFQDNEFEDNENIKTVVISNSVIRIKKHAFTGCGSFEKPAYVIIPSSVKSIDEEAFYCSNVEKVEISEGLENIGDWAFQENDSLLDIKIPKSVINIGEDVFGGCYSLKSIDVDIENTMYSSLNGVLFDKKLKTLIRYPAGKSDTKYKIPDGVTRIKSFAFGCGETGCRGCDKLESIIIPDSVVTIEENAFRGCENLESVVIPKSVRTIENSAFYKCYSLRDIYYAGTESEWNAINKTTFNKDNPNVVVHYNCKSKDDVLSKIEEEVRKLLSEGKSEKEIYSILKTKNISDIDIVDTFSRVKSDSPMVESFCNKVILPNITSLFSKNSGRSKYTVGEVARILYKKYPKNLVDSAIVSVLDNQYLVD